MAQARALLGAMQWRALQSAPHHSAKISLLQSSLPRGNKEVLQQINKICREMYQQRFLSASVKQLGAEKDEDVAFACFTDAAVGNRPDWSSTGGHIVGMVHRSFLSGKRGFFNPISWRSHKLERVARSSLSAEVQSLAEGEQELMYVRAEWAELLGYSLDPACASECTWPVPAALVVDAKSVYDCIQKGSAASSASSLKDKYTALELMAVSEHLVRQDTQLLWVSSDVQLADSLTKASAADLMVRFLQNDKIWVIQFDPDFISAKKKRQIQVSDPLPVVPEDDTLEDLTWLEWLRRNGPSQLL